MRVASFLVALLLTGCYGGSYRGIGATDADSMRARIDHVVAANAAEEAARLAAEEEARLRRAAAAAEACTTYVAKNPARPREVLDGVLAYQLVLGMTVEEIDLVYAGRALPAPAVRVEAVAGVPGQMPGVTITVSVDDDVLLVNNGGLAMWTGAGKGGPK